MILVTEVHEMETKDVIFGLRTKKGLSQDELAAKVMVTRQAVSRWENGETVPNTETLKLLSKGFRTGGSESPGIIISIPSVFPSSTAFQKNCSSSVFENCHWY